MRKIIRYIHIIGWLWRLMRWYKHFTNIIIVAIILPQKPWIQRTYKRESLSQFSLKYSSHRSNIYQVMGFRSWFNQSSPSLFPTVPSEIHLQLSLNILLNVNFFEEGWIFSPSLAWPLLITNSPPQNHNHPHSPADTQELSFSSCYHPTWPSEFMW